MYLFSAKTSLLNLSPFPLSPCLIYPSIHHISFYLSNISVYLCSTWHLHWVSHIPQTESVSLSWEIFSVAELRRLKHDHQDEVVFALSLVPAFLSVGIILSQFLPLQEQYGSS